jgi:hypothetical protein
MRGLVIAIVGFLFLSTHAAAQKYYSPDVQGIISVYGCLNCHPPSGGFDPSSYASIMTTGFDAPVVIAGDTNSLLVRKLKPDPPIGARMPFGGPYLSDDDIRTIVRWVADGAKEQAPTAIAGREGTVPSVFALDQNYPNPFNPTTTLSYRIPEEGQVTLRIYNLLGDPIATLVNGRQPAGEYAIRFDASRLPSGIYFSRLTFRGLTAVRSMLLMK